MRLLTTAWLAPLTCAIALGANISMAAPINYVESIDGELTGGTVFGTPLPILAFDIGTNTVSGTIAIIPNDWDHFAFSIPNGAELISADVQLTDTMTDFGGTFWRLYIGAAAFHTGTESVNVSASSPGSGTLSNVPLGAGTYNFSQIAMSAPAAPAAANFTFTFEVQPVPEPSTGVLAVVACALIALRRAARGDGNARA